MSDVLEHITKDINLDLPDVKNKENSVEQTAEASGTKEVKV